MYDNYVIQICRKLLNVLINVMVEENQCESLVSVHSYKTKPSYNSNNLAKNANCQDIIYFNPTSTYH